MGYTVKDILRLEVAPALGCTEPTAIALGAAAAASLLPGQGAVDRMETWLDPNIFKNGLGVSIPGTGGLSGLDLATALGALAGDPGLRMEVLQPVTRKDVNKALALVDQGRVRVNLMADHKGLYVKTRIAAGNDIAESVIQGLHDNIVSLSLNGEIVKKNALLSPGSGQGGNSIFDLECWLKDLSMERILSLVNDLDTEDLAFIRTGIDMNMALARYGLAHKSGLAVGATLELLAEKGLMARDMIHAARVLTSAAADARMAGAALPAMSSAGSGNHGLTAILPVKAVADHLGAGDEELLRAVGLSHVVTAWVKSHTGRLAAICACSVAAGAGAAAAIAQLLKGDGNQIGGAVENIIEDLAGVICDGAKNACALKLDTAAATAVRSALFAVNGLTVKMTDGIVGGSAQKTIQNVGILSSQGMVATDRTILKIMMDKIKGQHP
ncbi:MAG: serine dehydratase subunit alpha family protein [Desulfobacterium sp.]|nr:serine dehydratase subunit alpha family protein [Desulfobacterium sp.]